MDWLEVRVEKIREKVKNLPLKKAMTSYILVFSLLTVGLTIATNLICELWIDSIYISMEGDVKDSISGEEGSREYGSKDNAFKVEIENQDSIQAGLAGMDKEESSIYKTLKIIELWSPVVFAVVSMWGVSAIFYRNRLKEPFSILQHGVREVKRQNLCFNIKYDSRDEMGQLCESFEEMRVELLKGKEAMWEMIEKQKQVNSAFAHDLRTPLTVLKGYSDLLERYLPEGKISEEKLKDTLHLMSEHIRRLEKYTYTMKNIQSMEEFPMEKTSMDVLALQQKIQEILRALNQNGGISILYTSGLDCSRFINVDENIILEVLENLLSNGIRYAETNIQVSMELSDEFLYLYVQDDGPGFSEEALKKAVEPYYRESYQENQEKHYGIGLYICQILCEKHGGVLSLAKSLQKGSTVCASFSLHPNPLQ